MQTTADPSYRNLVTAGEPFRLLFPMGVVFALVGVLLWPAFVWGAMETYPQIMHARIMIECFMGAFVIGFLGTALPRLLEVPKVHGLESSLYALGLTLAFTFHLATHYAAGDALFLLSFSIFIIGLVRRFRLRKDMPPPAFVLVLLGLACAVIGVSALILSQFLDNASTFKLYQAGRLLLYQGFLLFPVMGVGAFLLPRFFELPNKQNLPESPRPSSDWWARASFAGACGAIGLISFALEYAGYLRAAYLLRAATITVFFWREVPVHKARFSQGSLALSMRVALASIPLGYLTMAALPARQITLLHVVFITGFGLLTLTVASRVILGHGGRSQLFKRSLWSIRILVALTILAMLTRISADWMPEVRMTHYAYAAIAWATAVALWMIRILPGIRNPDN